MTKKFLVTKFDCITMPITIATNRRSGFPDAPSLTDHKVFQISLIFFILLMNMLTSLFNLVRIVLLRI